ncbi:hypothetical protein MRX96_027202 [Rhipicephalus microplus]
MVNMDGELVFPPASVYRDTDPMRIFYSGPAAGSNHLSPTTKKTSVSEVADTSQYKPSGHGISSDVCNFPVASAVCDIEASPVYIYSPKDGSCFLTYDCTYFLNKFPTLLECYQTCKWRAAPQHVESSTTANATHGLRLPSYLEILQLRRTSALSLIPNLKIVMPSKPPTKDHRCLIPYRAPKRPFFHCRTRGWYFDNSTRQCVPSCKPAPFLTQLECIGVCRSVESCGFPVEGSLCLFEVFSVYAYDPITRNCFMTYDCSMFGNKFRTYKECRSTCVGGQYEALTQKIDYDSLLASSQQRFIGHPSQSQIQINGTRVGISSTAKCSGEEPRPPHKYRALKES